MILHSIGKRFKSFLSVKVFLKKDASATNKSYSQKNTSINSDNFVRKYYPDNQLKAELRYAKGKLNGLSYFYFESGKLMAKENYIDDQLDGLSKKYYESGKVKSEEYFKKGNLLFKRVFDLDGSLTQEIKN